MNNWTNKEIAILKKFYPRDYSLTEIHARIYEANQKQRSCEAIKTKARRLGLKRQ